MRRFFLSVALAIWAATLALGFINSKPHHVPTFKERWQPVIDHPLGFWSARRNFDFCWRCGIV